MKTYLVTGGAGFIGSNFILYMLKRYSNIRIINVDKLTYAGNLENLTSVKDDSRHIFAQADICDADAIGELFATYEPDYVVNFAAESHVDRSIDSPEIFAHTNITGTLTLLNAAREAWQTADGSYGTCKFLQVSTDEVYGSLSLDEPGIFFTESTPLDPHSPYSASKASADLFVCAYSSTYQLPINITRCSNNYGPFQFPEKLIPLMIHNALQLRALPVYGDGLNVRDWLYVIDHCKAIDLVLHKGTTGEVYNIGGHNEHPNIAIVKTIISQLANQVDSAITEELIQYVSDRKGHDRRYGIDPQKITEELGWVPETSFEEGIAQTIEWYLSNEEWVGRVTSGAYQDYYKNMYEGR
ncbi:MAG: dTDP-glucose 4,6-dehydratase [Coriobacteriia bacterium]|nr:dTDP-glucose 4,6-dehydratase [Coriobacteriia bacterium]